MQLRQALAQDERLLFDWANEPVVRAYARQSASIQIETHHQWFCQYLNDSNRIIYIGEVKNRPIGQVRFEYNPVIALTEIDISVDSQNRQHGVGRQLLALALQQCQRDKGWSYFLAVVAEQNIASHKLFQHLDFGLSSQQLESGFCCYYLDLSELF